MGRQKELAIRLASGATRTRLLRSFLYGISSFDPLICGAVAGILTLVALLACWFPARRATRLDPLRALKAE